MRPWLARRAAETLVGEDAARELTLTLDQAEPPIAARAVVVRIDGRGHAAVQFDGLSTYDQWRLVHYTVECQSREEFRHAEREWGAPPAGRLSPEEARWTRSHR